MNNLVSFRLPQEHQCRTGEVVKYGTKVCYVRERHTAHKVVHKLSIVLNDVQHLLGGSNPLDRDTIINGKVVHVCSSGLKQKKKNYIANLIG